jgi:hypothetical protein
MGNELQLKKKMSPNNIKEFFTHISVSEKIQISVRQKHISRGYKNGKNLIPSFAFIM